VIHSSYSLGETQIKDKGGEGLTKVRNKKVLSRKETRALIERAHEGDTEARELLVASNIRLVWNVLHRQGLVGAEADDYAQIGTIGLMKAIDRFDLSYNVAFSTYAVPMILGEIRRFRRDDGLVKVPRAAKEVMHKLRAMGYDRKDNIDIDKLTEELVHYTREQVERGVIYFQTNAQYVHSTDETVHESDGDSITLGDQLTGDVNPSNWFDHITIREAMGTIGERERRLIDLRYFQDYTQSEAAKELGVSQVQISRLEKRIITKLKEWFRKGDEENMVRYKNPKGDREEAIRLLQESDLTNTEIADKTGVPYGTMGKLALEYRKGKRTAPVKTKPAAKRAPVKGKKKTSKPAKPTEPLEHSFSAIDKEVKEGIEELMKIEPFNPEPVGKSSMSFEFNLTGEGARVDREEAIREMEKAIALLKNLPNEKVTYSFFVKGA
jgi:RNA polymerase sporulation-specific sigma factor